MSLDIEDDVFLDKKGRTITFEVGNDVVAHFQGDEVGRIDFDEDEDGNPFVFNMQVDAEYQRAGIGTELIRRAAEVHGRDFGRPSFTAHGGSNAQSHDHFTQDGAGLFDHCIKEGIIDDIQIFYDRREAGWWPEEDRLDDNV